MDISAGEVLGEDSIEAIIDRVCLKLGHDS